MKGKKVKIMSEVCSLIFILGSVFRNVVFAADPPSGGVSSPSDSPCVPAATAAATHRETDARDKKYTIYDCQRMEFATEKDIFNEINSARAVKLCYCNFCRAVYLNKEISNQNVVKLLSYFTFVKVLDTIGVYTEEIKSQMNWEIYSKCEGFYGKEGSVELTCNDKVEKCDRRGGICFCIVNIVNKNIPSSLNGKLAVFLEAMNFIGGLEYSKKFWGTGRDFQNLLGILEFVCYRYGDACYECGRVFSIGDKEPYTYNKGGLYVYICSDECLIEHCKRYGGRVASPQ